MPISQPKTHVGGANSPFTSGDHAFETPNLATLKLGHLFKFKTRPLDWHKQLLILSKLAGDLNRMGGFERTVLAADYTLTRFSKVFQRFFPGTGAYAVDLPAEELTEAAVFFLTNEGSAALTVRTGDFSPSPGTTVAVLDANASAWFYSDGTAWSFVEVTASGSGPAPSGSPGWLGPW